MAEQLPCKHQVVGSNPTGGSINGEVTEWFKVPVLKTGVGRLTVSSNLTFSAIESVKTQIAEYSINMETNNTDNVVSLAEWRQLHNKKLDDLIEEVEQTFKEYQLDEIKNFYDAEIYASENQASAYDELGLTNYADIVLEPNVSSCNRTLAWVSYILSGLGHAEESNRIDDIITSLECREQ